MLVEAEISELLQNRLFGVSVITEPLMSSKLVFIINTEDEWSRFSATTKQVFQSATIGRIEYVCFSAAVAANFPHQGRYLFDHKLFDGSVRLELILKSVAQT